MPSFVIHIAVAKEYIKNHKNEIKNQEEFIQGAIAPDLISIINKNEDKSKTHYGKWNNVDMEINLDKFLLDSKVDMEKDYWKGYFLHLLTDKKFYMECFRKETENSIDNNDTFYYDFDCLNKPIIEKYEIGKDYDENVTKYMKFVIGKPKYLKEEKVIKFIDEISKSNINSYI